MSDPQKYTTVKEVGVTENRSYSRIISVPTAGEPREIDVRASGADTIDEQCAVVVEEVRRNCGAPPA